MPLLPGNPGNLAQAKAAPVRDTDAEVEGGMLGPRISGSGAETAQEAAAPSWRSGQQERAS